MTVLFLLLFAVAFVLLLLHAFGVAARRVSLQSLGLALFVLVFLIQTMQKV